MLGVKFMPVDISEVLDREKKEVFNCLLILKGQYSLLLFLYKSNRMSVCVCRKEPRKPLNLYCYIVFLYRKMYLKKITNKKMFFLLCLKVAFSSRYITQDILFTLAITSFNNYQKIRIFKNFLHFLPERKMEPSNSV